MTSARRPLAALATAALVASPATGTAQNPYAEQVTAYLDEVEESTLSEEYVLEGESEGWMISGAEGATILRLPAGRFMVIGACDDDCSDIDLIVSRMDTEQLLDSDREIDAFPVLDFSLDQEADVVIGTSMPDCSTARCYAAYRWYAVEADGGTGPTAGVATWQDQVRIQLEAIPTPDGAEVADERTGLLGAGEELRFSINLAPGRFAGVAVCDNGCSNLDLAVYDAGGAMVSSDVLDDDVPIVDFDLVKAGGTYYFEIRMVECTTASCGYGFRLYRERQE
ncbi:MAG: hypothetical protein R6U63_07910 [Longimicrobiales bacterium]